MYHLVYYNTVFNYYKIIGIGKDKKKAMIQSKKYILYYLRTKYILNYTHDYINTLEFEIDLRYLFIEDSKLIYEQEILEETFSFFFITDSEKNMLNNSKQLNYKFIYNLIFPEDKRIAQHIFNTKLYNFDIDIIDYPLLKLEYNSNFNFNKIRSRSYTF
tara:strand:- start:111 stop:587 length:477 start_codon:yes stop_codon:yes gene_type:complete